MKMKKLAVLIIGTMLFLNLHAGLVTHLEFEDNFDDSFGEHDWENGPVTLTENNSVNFTSGKEGSGIYFDGDDYIEIGKNGDFNPRGADNSYSISLWVKSTEAASSSNANCYIGKHTDSGGNVFLLGYWSSALKLQIQTTAVTVSTSAEPQEWTHYVVTAKENGTSTSVKVYKDGAQIWTGTVNNVLGTFSSDDKPWVLGQDWDSSTGGSDWFKGYMDNVRFYDNELDADYVKQIYLKESSMVHLALDDNYEDSAGSYDGWQNNGVVFKSGMENRAASLDGYNDYIEFGTPTTDPRLISGSYKYYSISLWVKSNSAATTSNNNCYIGKHDNLYDNIFLLGYWNATLRLQIGSHYVTVSTATEPTEWTHYVVTASETSTSTTVVVYKNGENIWFGTIADTMGGTFQSNYQEWVLGMDWDASGPSDRFYGYIDNVRFYKKYLSAVEVKQLYLSEFSGLRYCNTTQYAAGCTTTTETDNDLNDTWWWIPSGGIGGGYLVSTASVESIKVSEGWEAYLCTSTNSQGTCHYFDDGVYASGTGLPSELLNSTYSITVQPKTFDAAKKYFGYKKVGESGNLPVGFAYFYQYANYAKPTKENDRRRLFMDSLNRNNFQNMSNTILGAYRATSAELFGNVYAILSDNSYNDKYLMTSHRDFSINPESYPDLDFRDYDDNVKQIWLMGENQEVGSVGWFMANDVAMVQDRVYIKEVCLKGIDDTSGYDIRIECMQYGKNNIALESGVSADDFYERVYIGNHQKFEKYADNYSLLMFNAHGDYNESDPSVEIWAPNCSYDDPVLFSSGDNNYSNKLGKFNTKWVQSVSCNSMGKSNISYSEVGDVYYNSLNRLNGIGGFRNPAYFGGSDDPTDYYDYWQDLLSNSKTISKAWVDSWTQVWETSWWDEWERDARFLTLEDCDCTQTECTSYMKNDYFFNVQTGPMDQKTTTTGYNYYCFRDKESPNFRNYVRTLNKSMPEETYPEEFSSYSIEPVADSIIEELMGIKIGGKETRAKGENDYSYRDDYLIMKKRGKDFSSIMNRTQESFRYDSDWEYEAKDRFEEVKAIAETLTTLDLEYAGISKDTNEAFEVGGDGESLGKSVNSISFVFWPKIGGIEIFNEKIEVEYDSNGLYQIKSNVPYAVSLSKIGAIKSEEKAVEELSKSVTIEEAEKGKIVYAINKYGELELSWISLNKEKNLFVNISLDGEENE